jgi:hypothetical protein
MEETFVKLVGDLVASIGVPGALLMVLAYGWLKSQPVLLTFLTSTTKSLEQIAMSMVDLRKDLDELREDVRKLTA